MSMLEPRTSKRGAVHTGSRCTLGGQSHSCERATRSRSQPSAHTISVALAIIVTIRMVFFLSETQRAESRERPVEDAHPQPAAYAARLAMKRRSPNLLLHPKHVAQPADHVLLEARVLPDFLAMAQRRVEHATFAVGMHPGERVIVIDAADAGLATL